MLCSKDLIQDFTVDANAMFRRNRFAIAYSRYALTIAKRLLWSVAFQLAIQLRWLKWNMWDGNPTGKWLFLERKKKEKSISSS